MNAKTLRALKASVAHWERMRDHPICLETPSSRDCPLCQLFVKRTGECDGCPISNTTGQPLCGGTPYPSAHSAWLSARFEPAEWKRAANREIRFLKKLLPKEVPQ